MSSDAGYEPIDGRAWSEYNRAGRAHFDRVQRSWTVFSRNANELVGLLHAVETDAVASLRLMQDFGSGDEELDRFHREFWKTLDQRLHNLVSSAFSIVDHTRPLVTFYEDEPAFQDEFKAKNDVVARSPRASFLRRLRNYLLHYGVAPLMQTMSLGPTTSAEWDHLQIKLSARGLLAWSGWNQVQRQFLESFDGGPPLREVCVAYADDMRDLYTWLFQQHPALHVPAVPPPHLTEGRADWVRY